VSDLLAGQLQMGFSGAPVMMPLARQGRLRALGISSARQSPVFPDLPTPSTNKTVTVFPLRRLSCRP
jgi:tripartite-type tricarboxylate transporter receptor subunit TctC